MKRYLIPNPKSSEEKTRNKENFLFEEQVLTLRKADLIQGKYNIKNPNKGKLWLI